MSDNFNALVISQEGEKFSREIKKIDKSFLKHGDVLVKVDYSTLNFKDALILKNGARLVKEFPHIPGIDFAGTVVACSFLIPLIVIQWWVESIVTATPFASKLSINVFAI